MPDLLKTIRDELDTRMHKLHPFVTEYEQLLTDVADQQTAAATPVRPVMRRVPPTLTPSPLHRPRRVLARPAFPKTQRRG